MKRLEKIAVIALAVMFMASCGGGSDSYSGKKIASNEFLGNMPNLVYQKQQSDSIREAKVKEATKDLKFTNESDIKKAMKLSEKFNAEKELAKEKFEADIEALKPSLMGKDIPAEVSEGVGYKIINCKITEISDYTVYAEFTLEVTDLTAVSTFGKDIIVTWQYVNKNNEPMGGNSAAYIQLSEKANGGTASQRATIVVSADYVDFAKIRFIK